MSITVNGSSLKQAVKVASQVSGEEVPFSCIEFKADGKFFEARACDGKRQLTARFPCEQSLNPVLIHDSFAAGLQKVSGDISIKENKSEIVVKDSGNNSEYKLPKIDKELPELMGYSGSVFQEAYSCNYEDFAEKLKQVSVSIDRRIIDTRFNLCSAKLSCQEDGAHITTTDKRRISVVVARNSCMWLGDVMMPVDTVEFLIKNAKKSTEKRSYLVSVGQDAGNLCCARVNEVTDDNEFCTFEFVSGQYAGGYPDMSKVVNTKTACSMVADRDALIEFFLPATFVTDYKNGYGGSKLSIGKTVELFGHGQGDAKSRIDPIESENKGETWIDARLVVEALKALPDTAIVKVSIRDQGKLSLETDDYFHILVPHHPPVTDFT